MNSPSHQAGEWQRQAWIPVLPIRFNGLLSFPCHFPFRGYSKLSKPSSSSTSSSSLTSMLNCLVSLSLNYFRHSLKSHSVWLFYHTFFSYPCQKVSKLEMFNISSNYLCNSTILQIILVNYTSTKPKKTFQSLQFRSLDFLPSKFLEILHNDV